MKAIDLHNHMKEIGKWVDWENTVDRFIIGDPETEVKGIAVAWQSRTQALKEAIKRGCNLFVTHEPTFYRHREDSDSIFSDPQAELKRKFIQDNGLVIYRCHDVWDQMPEIGIVDSWAKHLGLGRRVASAQFTAVHESPAWTLGDLAKHVAAATEYLGQPWVEVVGDLNKPVSKVGIGCGAIIRVRDMVELGADVIIGTDDGTRYWYTGAWALETDTPLIIVNHASSEEPGLRNLVAYISQQFSQVKTEFIAQGCMYSVLK
ncbi:MAG: Nif3-like dinuclear metal center hexameric protein [Armatimonadota bacterium]|nr:Nif3-like dinuclear metal center hexameric protein [Armatimonadota bacterium]